MTHKKSLKSIKLTAKPEPKSQEKTLGHRVRKSSKMRDIEGERFFALALDMLCIANMEGYFIKINPAFQATLGYSEGELLNKPFLELVHPDDRESTLAEMRSLSDGKITLYFENRYLCKDGHYKWLAWKSVPYLDEGLTYAIAREITEQKEHQIQTEKLNAELEMRVSERMKDIQQQIERMDALRKIDNAILGSVDIRVTLDVFLDQVTSQLGVDAAAVLSANFERGSLEYVEGRGFRTKEIKKYNTMIGKGIAGRVALERKVLTFLDLKETDFCRPNLVEKERVVSYVGVPLIAKSRVIGVLEIFNREKLSPDEDWFDYLSTIAAQGAIAIQNAEIFSALEQSNLELRLAYDATLEGWVKALDLRDHETEGHTQRVTDLTVQLAYRMGIPESEISHIRRGSLLHDIGKIGVPDHILLKPGKLTDEEMEQMKKHPVYAYEWLSPIKYLKPALDIPYCHHEKWDGTGYPRGLVGESIPLSARLFAVVDVWDALTSDRPYRKAWAHDRAYEYIKSESGKHFDPKVVEVFLSMMKELELDFGIGRAA